MNRESLTWALNAVLPHCGKSAYFETDAVCFQQRDGRLHIGAFDGYTAGIARIESDRDWSFALRAKEATDLLRFVRPALVAEKEEQPVWAVNGSELHIAAFRRGERETAVFDLFTPERSVGFLLDYIAGIYNLGVEWNEQIYLPEIVARFAKAEREYGDRLRILPRRYRREDAKYGVSVVTVGNHFIGAIAGMSYDQQSDDVVSSFLGTEEAAA